MRDIRLLIICLVLASSPAQGQESDTLEEIVVTGSRIARDPNLSGSLPVQSIDAADIRRSGEFEISDVLNDIPALLTSITAEQSITQANVLNLRGLGSVRTLVLVNGRRHVAGEAGTASVDVGSIPPILIERVEVLTGGASAIYGADAVTGVINFILKDDYEGFGVNANYGISADGDAQQTAITASWGTNFSDGRGNISVSFDYRTDDGILQRDRPGEYFGSAALVANPALRFQMGDIDSIETPNLAEFYNFANTGLFEFGLPIPSNVDFVARYNAAFGTDPVLTPAEVALFDRAGNAFPRAVVPQATFSITSGFGVIIPGNPFTFQGFDPLTSIDIDNNGNPDCLDSFTGYNSAFTAGSFGLVGGCWSVGADGNYLPVRNGLIVDNFRGAGGDAFFSFVQGRDDIINPSDKIAINFFGHYDLSRSLSVFGELKYVNQQSEHFIGGSSFWDLLFGAADNPFIPEFLQPLTQLTGGIAITVDPVYFDSIGGFERDTTRAVVGLQSAFKNDWNVEVSANYGRYEDFGFATNRIIVDRWFAAIDAVIDAATGQPACRVDIDPLTPPIQSPTNIPSYEPGYYSFTPGAGNCVPINIWAGRAGLSEAAVDWATTTGWGNAIIDQFVLSAIMSGDTSEIIELPAGAISFALGFEYRDESSDLVLDPWSRGIIPSGAQFPAGSNVAVVSDNSSLIFHPQVGNNNEFGGFDVSDVFLEISAPLLANVPGARELTIDAAIRHSDYSTIGQSTTWKANVVYAPLKSVALRGSLSEAVRAPNIGELFAPESGARFNLLDPCDTSIISVVAVNDPQLAQQTQDNCVLDLATLGIDPFDATTGDYSFINPLSASVVGVFGGNTELLEETARTVTAGLIYEPSFLDGFSLTVDLWDISIDGAIEDVAAQDIANGCYQGGSLNPAFCQHLARNADPLSIFFGGISFIRSTKINYASLETFGIDLAANYEFEIGVNAFSFAVQATRVNEIDFFTNPLNPSEVDRKLGEYQRPELAGNVYLNWARGDFRLGWQSQFMDEQLLRGAEIENAHLLYGPPVTMDQFWQHHVSASYELGDQWLVYGGIRNVSAEAPFANVTAFPTSARGRFFFVGVDFRN